MIFSGILHRIISSMLFTYCSLIFFIAFGIVLIIESVTEEVLEGYMKLDDDMEITVGTGAQVTVYTTHVQHNSDKVGKSFYDRLMKLIRDLKQFTIVVVLIIAEFGDKSQFMAIALNKEFGFLPVVLGGVIGNSAAVAVSIVLGLGLGKICDRKLINAVGGVFFVII